MQVVVGLCHESAEDTAHCEPRAIAQTNQAPNIFMVAGAKCGWQGVSREFPAKKSFQTTNKKETDFQHVSMRPLAERAESVPGA